MRKLFALLLIGGSIAFASCGGETKTETTTDTVAAEPQMEQPVDTAAATDSSAAPVDTAAAPAAPAPAH